MQFAENSLNKGPRRENRARLAGPTASARAGKRARTKSSWTEAPLNPSAGRDPPSTPFVPPSANEDVDPRVEPGGSDKALRSLDLKRSRASWMNQTDGSRLIFFRRPRGRACERILSVPFFLASPAQVGGPPFRKQGSRFCLYSVAALRRFGATEPWIPAFAGKANCRILWIA